jgi:hypothetical protein
MAAYLWPYVARAEASKLGVYVLGTAALLNLHWTVTMRGNAADLAVGYYVWVISFVLLLLSVHPGLVARKR